MDIILYNIITGICALFIGYIFGSIPTGVIIGKVFFHKDPRLLGSKNSGGTNVGRLFGKKVGLIVIILDILKCVIPTISACLIIKYSGLKDVLASETWNNFHILYIYLVPVGVTLGHCWPLFANFKGGKAVAELSGFVACTCWGGLTIGIITFFSTLKWKKHVSLSSISIAAIEIIFAWLVFGLSKAIPSFNFNIFMWGFGSFFLLGWEYASAVTIIGLILIVRHHSNIKRLMNHEERKISWLK